MTRTILIVDDDPMIRKLIATTLEDISGYRLQEAGDRQRGMRAREHLQRQPGPARPVDAEQLRIDELERR